ncbi:MAG: uroporphyrinogen-III synthase [Nitriliruptor sp.]|nr:MAG: uroporphyrinogen-III synthase [Nitriliruptor sp.]
MSAEVGPLAGQRVLVARTRQQAAELSRRVRELGGEPVEAPVLEIAPGDEPALSAALDRVARGEVAVLALTSPNGVDAVADAMAAADLPASILGRVGLVACVGRGTEDRLAVRLGRRADLLPPRATTRSLGAAIPPGRGAALLPRADLASSELPAALVAKGYEVDEVVAYRILQPAGLPEPVLAQLAEGAIDLVAVTSPSTVHNLVALLAGRAWSARLVSIGPVTTAACASHGLSVAAEADPHDLDGLLAALVAAAR